VLAIKHAGALFLLFLHCLLPLYRRLLPMSNHNCLLAVVLLRLGVGLSMSLSRSVQLFGTCHQLLGIGVEQVNGSSLLSEQALHLIQLLSLHRRLLLLRGGTLLEQRTPLCETLLLFLNIAPLSLVHILRLA
jgi:hypothetical protein